MWEMVAIVAAVAAGALAVFLIVWRQAKSGAAGRCSGCRYGADPSECDPPEDFADAPPRCPKLK
jgi:hypothetical protein